MKLGEYFEATKGHGVLATSGTDGQVNAAIYSRPHVIDEETVVFIMADRLSHANTATNPHAAYLFIENGPGYSGKRLYLTKVEETSDPEAIQALRRRIPPMCEDRGEATRFLVHFRIDKVLPLVGV